MPRRHKNLFAEIACFSSLHEAARRAIRGKRAKPGAAAFMANRERELLRLERRLNAGTWRPGRYVEIEIRDPKPRLVSAAPFPDRVVHHALCAVIGPLFENGFIHDSYANRKGRGTHRAIARYERYRDRFRHVLRCDIFRYFPAIDHAVLKQDLRRRIACEPTLWLMDAIIDGSNPQEPVNLYYPGDDLFAPFERRRGLPIGNLTSQLFANLHLDGLDHFVKEVLRVKGYLRYVDDFALFHDDAGVLAACRDRISAYLAQRRLSLHPEKTRIQPCAGPAEFLGFVLLPGGRRRLPEGNVRRFRNRLRGLRDRWRAGTVDLDEVQRRVGAWVAHAEHADTWRLREAIFRGGLFDPAGPLSSRPERRKPLLPVIGAWPVPWVRAGVARRVLEQQTGQRALCQPQQEQHREPEQQPGFSASQYTPSPEPRRPSTARACAGVSRTGHDERAISGVATGSARLGPCADARCLLAPCAAQTATLVTSRRRNERCGRGAP